MKYCGANTAFPVTNDFVLHMSGARFCIATETIQFFQRVSSDSRLRLSKGSVDFKYKHGVYFHPASPPEPANQPQCQ